MYAEQDAKTGMPVRSEELRSPLGTQGPLWDRGREQGDLLLLQLAWEDQSPPPALE